MIQLKHTLLASLLLGLLPISASAEMVNVYSARKEALIKPLLEVFSEETGITVNLLTGKADSLLKRIQVEGRSSPADVFITVDAGRLHRATSGGVLQPISSEILEQKIPANLRDPENHWFSLSRRARPIFYSLDRIDSSKIKRYEDLANSEWKNTLCLRSSNAVYNQSLVASMLIADGEENTGKWIEGIVANLAQPPAGGDTEQLLAIAAGACDITMVNTYYYGRMLASDDNKHREAAAKIGIIWPNQEDRGTHVNVSGAGVVKTARNKANAIKLIEFLVRPESQAWYASVNNEYPVVLGSEVTERLQNLGEFKADSVNLMLLGENNLRAVKVMDRSGWR